MGKRKQSGELKSIPIPIQVHKYKDLHTLRAQASTHWNVDHIQPFFPSLEMMFKTENIENVRDHGIKLDEPIQSIQSSSSIVTTLGATESIHIKQSSILNTLKWMRGDYGGSIGLPTSAEDSDKIRKKLQSFHNSAYVGSLISSVLSQTRCIHFPKVYGIYTGIAKKHTFDISDDYEDLIDRPWFTQNIGKTFELKLADHIQNSPNFSHTRTARMNVQLSDESIQLDDVSEIDGIQVDEPVIADMNQVFDDTAESMSDNESDSSSVSTSYIFDINSCACSDIDEMEIDEDDEEDEGYAWATVFNVPVQLTVMERCEGTLYQLMCLERDSTKHTAWVTQVMFALAYAQRTLGLTHNDLHSNNVMYVKTDKEYLWYRMEGQTYKVPTYGYLIKIIDFERGIASIRATGMKQPKTFVSDHFSANEEAGGQYNIEPFYLEKYERIKPNPSFDLVRLATSMFWDLFPEGPEFEEYKMNPVFQTIVRWMTLEDGTSILFGKSDPYHDRYHGFHLYKAIARLCKDTAVPRREILKLFDVFGVENVCPMQDMDLMFL